MEENAVNRDQLVQEPPLWTRELPRVPWCEEVKRQAPALRVEILDFIKRFKYKGPVFQISALTREGCEGLIRDIYKHLHTQHLQEQGPVDVDPRFTSSH